MGIDDTRLIMDVDFFYDIKGGEFSHITVVDKSTFQLSSGDIDIKSGFDV